MVTAPAGHEFGYGSKPTQTATVYSRSFFTPSSTDHAKFVRLVRDFDLQVMDSPSSQHVTRNTAQELREEERVHAYEKSGGKRWEAKIAKELEESRGAENAEKDSEAEDGEEGNPEGKEAEKETEQKRRKKTLAPPLPKSVQPGFVLLHTSFCGVW